jgi:hypothetical protein
LKSASFWLLALSLGIDSMAFQGINISLAPYIQDLGYSDAMLATVMTFRAAMAAGVLPFVGLLAEHCHRVSVRVVPFVIHGIAVSFFLLAKDPVFLWLAVALYGLGISAISVTQEVIWANYFGRLSLGVVRSLSFMVSFGFGAAGPIVINLVFDVLDSYRPAFIAIIGFLAVSAFIMGVVKPPKAHRFATAAEMTPSAGKPQSH